MLTIDRILFPTDVSDRLAGAAPLVWGLAERFSAEVHLLHNLEPQSAPHHDDLAEAADPGAHFLEVEREITERLQALAEELGKGGHRVEVAVPQRLSPAEAICDYAQEKSIDLIVMVTHSGRSLADRLFGSVTHDVIRAAHCSVLTVTGRDAREGRDWKRLLVPVELGDPEQRAMEVAAELLESDGSVHLLHIFEAHLFPKFYGFPGSEKTYYSFNELEQGMETSLRALWQGKTGSDGAVTAEIRKGRVASEILKTAEKTGSDLILMCEQHHDHLFRSIAETVAFDASPCPVLLLKT